MRRLLIAFVLAPAMPALVMLVLSVFMGSFWEGLWVFKLMAMVAYMVAIVVGIPTFFILRKAKANGLLPYIVAGQLVSLTPAAYFVLLPSIHQYGQLKLFPANYVQLALIALIGFVVTVAFWLIARPDRSAA